MFKHEQNLKSEQKFCQVFQILFTFKKIIFKILVTISKKGRYSNGCYETREVHHMRYVKAASELSKFEYHL